MRLHCRNAKACFNDAVERELMNANPFRKLTSTAVSAERDRYITPKEADSILDKCPDIRWKVLFGLARFAGLRVPSETHLLTWGDVDWQRGRLSVYAPKTERFPKHRRRPVPIVPKLMTILQDAFDAAAEGQERVVALSRNNLHRMVRSVVQKAGLEPWKDLFQALRRSCDTEWKQTFPAYAVDGWLGHSGQVSEKHYLMVPDDLWDRAAGLDEQGAEKSAAECAAKSAAVGSRTESQGVAAEESDTVVSVDHNPANIGVFAPYGPENVTAPPGTRTPDPLIKSQLLCQLS